MLPLSSVAALALRAGETPSSAGLLLNPLWPRLDVYPKMFQLLLRDHAQHHPKSVCCLCFLSCHSKDLYNDEVSHFRGGRQWVRSRNSILHPQDSRRISTNDLDTIIL